LFSMAVRARDIGGTLMLGDRPGGGTVVHLHLALQAVPLTPA